MLEMLTELSSRPLKMFWFLFFKSLFGVCVRAQMHVHGECAGWSEDDFLHSVLTLRPVQGVFALFLSIT